MNYAACRCYESQETSNIDQVNMKTFLKDAQLYHYLLFAAFVTLGILVYYCSYQYNQSHLLGSVLFLSSFGFLCFSTLGIQHLLKLRHKQRPEKKSVLLLSHDDELYGQLRYLLPYKQIDLHWVRTYDDAIDSLADARPFAFIVDTENKPKNTATLIEQSRSYQGHHRLPIIAIQSDLHSQKKMELLLEGFDDCLTKSIKPSDISDFFKRWSHQEDTTTHIDHHDDNAKEINSSIKEILQTEPNISLSIFDKNQAMIQSHQNAALAKDMLVMLIDMVNKHRQLIIEYYDQKLWDELGELTHKIKGGCYCSGVPQLQSAIECIDKSLEKNELGNISQQFDQLILAIDHLSEWHRESDIELLFLEESNQPQTTSDL